VSESVPETVTVPEKMLLAGAVVARAGLTAEVAFAGCCANRGAKVGKASRTAKMARVTIIRINGNHEEAGKVVIKPAS
jgi:hypothetical protein